MLELEPGIQVRGISREDIFITDGASEYDSLSKETQELLGNYHPHCLIPQLSWRRPSDREVSRIIADEDESSDSLEVVRIGTDALLEAMAISNGENNVGVNLINESRRWINGDVKELYFRKRIARYTSTIDKNGFGLGLHFDEFGSPRLFINTGFTPRYFCFLNQSLSRIASITGVKQPLVRALLEYDCLPNHRDRRRKLLPFVENYPLIILTINPGYAWLYNKPNTVLHDGLGMVGQEESFVSLWNLERYR